MSAEITAQGSLTFNSTEDVLTVNGIDINMTGTRFTHDRQAVTASDVAISLGGVGSGTLGWFLLINRSTTLTFSIKTATSGTIILSLLPGEFAMGRFGSGVTAPAVVSSTTGSVLEYVIFEA